MTSSSYSYQQCHVVILFLVSNIIHSACNAFTLPVGINAERWNRCEARTAIVVPETSESTTDSNVVAATAIGRRSVFLALPAVTTVFVATPEARAAATTTKKALSEEYRQGTAVLGGRDEDGVLPREAYRKLPSGVVYADTRVGGGDAIDRDGVRANFQWVLRKSNGYFVDSSATHDSVPFIYTVGDRRAAIAGLDEGVRGMRVGGVRRLLIPPSQAYVEGLDDGKPGPLPVGFGPRQQMRRVQQVRGNVPGEYIYLEVQLTRLR